MIFGLVFVSRDFDFHTYITYRGVDCDAIRDGANFDYLLLKFSVKVLWLCSDYMYLCVYLAILCHKFSCYYLLYVSVSGGKRRGRKTKYQSSELTVPVCSNSYIYIERDRVGRKVTPFCI